MAEVVAVSAAKTDPRIALNPPNSSSSFQQTATTTTTFIHFLRCPECAFVSIDLNRFDHHLPCCLRDRPTKYFTYACDKCQALSTSRDIMEEHGELYHKGCKVSVIECQRMIKPVGLSSFGRSSPPNVVICTLCNYTCYSSDELVKHVQHLHSRAPVNSAPLLHPAHALSSMPVAWPVACSASKNTSITHHIQSLSAAHSVADSPKSHPTCHHSCFACGAVFRTASHLEVHINNLHSDRQHNMSDNQMMMNVNSCHSSSIRVSTPNDILTSAAVSSMSAMDTTKPSSSFADFSMVNSQLRPLSDSSESSNSDDRTMVSLPSKSFPLVQLKMEINTDLNEEDERPSSPGANISVASTRHLTSDICSNGASVHQTDQLVHNTMRKTKSDMKVIRRFFHQQRNELREPHLIPALELDAHLQDFVTNARKKDGNEYEPESLKAFVHSLERHLKVYGYHSSVLRDSTFSGTRNAMQTRLQALRAHSRAGMTGVTTTTIGIHGSTYASARKLLSAETTCQLIRNGLLGPNSPQSLLNTLWYINRVHFCIRGTHKHRNLTWGQFQLLSVKDKENANAEDVKGKPHEYLQFSPNPLSDERRFYLPNKSANNQGLPLDAVDVFRVYSNMRPVESRNSNDPFYLMPDPSFEHGGAWFKFSGVGMNVLASIPKKLGIRTPNNVAGGSSVIRNVQFKDSSMDDTFAESVNSAATSNHFLNTVSSLRFAVPNEEDFEDYDEDADSDMAVDMSMH